MQGQCSPYRGSPRSLSASLTACFLHCLYSSWPLQAVNLLSLPTFLCSPSSESASKLSGSVRLVFGRKEPKRGGADVVQHHSTTSGTRRKPLGVVTSVTAEGLLSVARCGAIKWRRALNESTGPDSPGLWSSSRKISILALFHLEILIRKPLQITGTTWAT